MAKGNPLDVLPPRLRKWSSTDAALAFLEGRDRQLSRMGGVWNVHVKISVGGPWGVGKSTMVRSIAEGHCPELGHDDRTIGLDLVRWNPAASGRYSGRLLHYFESLLGRRRSWASTLEAFLRRGRSPVIEDARQRCCFQFFDLGGHDEYRTAHLHFANDSDVAIVVFDALRTMKEPVGTAAEDVDIDMADSHSWKQRCSPEEVVEWISSLYAVSESAQFMLVGTHTSPTSEAAMRAGREVWEALTVWAREHGRRLRFLGRNEKENWYNLSFEEEGRKVFHFVDVVSDLGSKDSVCEALVNAAISRSSVGRLAGFGAIQSPYAEYLADCFVRGTTGTRGEDRDAVADWPPESRVVTVDMCADELRANPMLRLDQDRTAARREAVEALKQLHGSGRVFYWNDAGSLNNLVFTRVQWVLHYAREVLRHNVQQVVARQGADDTIRQLAGILETDGLCHERLLRHLWSDLKEAWRNMIEVVCRIELAVRCEDSSAFTRRVVTVGGEGHVWLIPTRRPSHTTSWPFPDCDSVTVGKVVTLKEPLRPGFFARAAVRIAARFPLTDFEWWEQCIAGVVDHTDDAMYLARLEADDRGRRLALRIRVQLHTNHASWAPGVLRCLEDNLSKLDRMVQSTLDAK